MESSSDGSGKRYFNLHITGLGYLNRIREVKPRKGDPFLACDIAALNGPSDDVEYCRFDTKVSGTDAQHLIRKCSKAVNAGRKVLIGFRLGDLWVDQFTYTKGDKAGQPGVSLKARLLFVSFIKIDKQVVYKAEPQVSGETAHSEPPESEPTSVDGDVHPPQGNANPQPSPEADAIEATGSF